LRPPNFGSNRGGTEFIGDEQHGEGDGEDEAVVEGDEIGDILLC
jgi:hypothetical protein